MCLGRTWYKFTSLAAAAASASECSKNLAVVFGCCCYWAAYTSKLAKTSWLPFICCSNWHLCINTWISAFSSASLWTLLVSSWSKTLEFLSFHTCHIAPADIHLARTDSMVLDLNWSLICLASICSVSIVGFKPSFSLQRLHVYLGHSKYQWAADSGNWWHNKHTLVSNTPTVSGLSWVSNFPYRTLSKHTTILGQWAGYQTRENYSHDWPGVLTAFQAEAKLNSPFAPPVHIQLSIACAWMFVSWMYCQIGDKLGNERWITGQFKWKLAVGIRKFKPQQLSVSDTNCFIYNQFWSCCMCHGRILLTSNHSNPRGT